MPHIWRDQLCSPVCQGEKKVTPLRIVQTDRQTALIKLVLAWHCSWSKRRWTRQEAASLSCSRWRRAAFGTEPTCWSPKMNTDGKDEYKRRRFPWICWAVRSYVRLRVVVAGAGVVGRTSLSMGLEPSGSTAPSTFWTASQMEVSGRSVAG